MDVAAWMGSDEGRLWTAYLHGTRALDRALDAALRVRAGIGHADFDILARLAQAPGRRLRMGRLAELLVAPNSRLNYRIELLVQGGLVTREPHPRDRRGLDVVLTDHGRRVVDSAAAAHVETVRAHLLAHLSPVRRRQLYETLGRIVDDLNAG